MDTPTNGSSPKLRIVDVDELAIGENVFQSSGTCVVKVTVDGVEEGRRFRIRSTAFSEALDRMRELAPHAPTTAMFVRWDSDAGRQLGITREQNQRLVQVPNTNDEGYQKRLADYNKKLTFENLNAGLVVTLRENPGGPIIPETNTNARIAALEKMGLTVHHFNQLNAAIDRLTQVGEEQRGDFLEDVSDAASIPLTA